MHQKHTRSSSLSHILYSTAFGSRWSGMCFSFVQIKAYSCKILMIYYQSIYGAKFFYPERFLPLQYDYLYSLPDDLEAGLVWKMFFEE